MKLFRFALLLIVLALPHDTRAQSFSDVTDQTFEKEAIQQLVQRGWMQPHTSTLFGYGVTITPDDWLRLLMFLRTQDACPELGTTANSYWTAENIRACLGGAGVPVETEQTDRLRRDEAMQQLFALRRRSFAFQELQTKPPGFVNPTDFATIPIKRQGAMIAADRLKLLFRTKNALLPALPLLREDAALSVWRFLNWERQGGVDQETHEQQSLSKEAHLDHWRDIDTDIYVIQVKTGGDTLLRPIIPRRSFNPAEDPHKDKRRDEYVYESVSDLAKEAGALAAINGSYFNVEWPWGAFEDTTMVDGKVILERSDRSTFVVCRNGTFFIGTYAKQSLEKINCTPEHMLGAGPLFISEGNVLIESTKEGFDEYTKWERRVGKNARTAIGISIDRKTAYLIVVAGKSYPAFGRGGSSLGVFLKEKYPAIHAAMMYDGGGSTTLYVKKELLVGMGISRGEQERSVISALGVFSKKALAQKMKQFKKDQIKHWDHSLTKIKIKKPTEPLPWQTAKEAKDKGQDIALVGSRGASIRLPLSNRQNKIFFHTFDRVITDKTSHLTLTRREGKHEHGWIIPIELHVLNEKDESDTDIIALFPFLPKTQTPDLKTFDAIAFRPTGVVFGDATGRHWFYYTKAKQLSPAVFKESINAKR